MAKLKEQFARIEFRIKAIADGMSPGLILCGPPGWAKTHTVVTTLRAHGIEPVVATVLNEHAFAHTLMQNAAAPVILVDDNDALASRPACLNIAKQAFGPDHVVTWDSREAQKIFGSGIQFKMKGRLIWISNRDYTNSETRGEELEAHWSALASRGIRPVWLDVTDVDDAFRYVIRLACTSPKFWHLKRPLSKAASEEVIRFFCTHRNHLSEISPRAMTLTIDAFHMARDDIEQRDNLLLELLSPRDDQSGKHVKLRNIARDLNPLPTIVRKDVWRDVPD